MPLRLPTGADVEIVCFPKLRGCLRLGAGCSDEHPWLSAAGVPCDGCDICGGGKGRVSSSCLPARLQRQLTLTRAEAAALRLPPGYRRAIQSTGQWPNAAEAR